MANYNVDIAIALKNSNKLIALRKELRGATKEITEFNKQAREQNKVLPVSINSFNKQLVRARRLLDKAAVGTSSFNRAARALVNVEKEHNNQLMAKEKLLNKLRLRQTLKAGGTVSAADFKAARTRAIPTNPIRDTGFLDFSKAADKITNIGKDTKKIAVSTKKSSQILSQQATAAVFKDLPFGVKGGQIGAAAPLTRAEKMGFGRRGSPGGLFAMPGGASGRLKGGVGSALIGGGFPALFGAGGLSSILGGLAGGIGGALAPGGGFAASIFATAIAAEIEKIRNFRKAVRTLNEDLKNAGATTQFTRKEIKALGKDLDITKEEATELVAQFSKFADVGGLDLARLFGSRDLFDATIGLNDFSSTLSRIQQLSEELTLGTEFEAYKILSTEGAEAANDFIINSLLASKQADVFTERFEESLKRVKRFTEGGVGITEQLTEFNKLADITAFGNKEFNRVLEAIIAENDEIQAILQDESKSTLERLREVDKVLVPILQNTDLLKDALSKLPPEFDLSVEKAKKLVDELSNNVEKLQFVQEFKAPEEEIRKLLNPMRQVLDLSNQIKIGFEDSFKGIIKGTMSVQDAFRNMLNRIADYFLDFAAQLLALQVQKGFLSLFSSMFTIGQVGETGLTSGDRMLGSRGMGRRANGGIVNAGKSYMVGERGAEMFVPNAGGRIVPNSDLGGSTNIVVNVDASGSSVEGDEQQSRELGRIISVAIQSELIKQKRPGGMLA